MQQPLPPTYNNGIPAVSPYGMQPGSRSEPSKSAIMQQSYQQQQPSPMMQHQQPPMMQYPPQPNDYSRNPAYAPTAATTNGTASSVGHQQQHAHFNGASNDLNQQMGQMAISSQQPPMHHQTFGPPAGVAHPHQPPTQSAPTMGMPLQQQQQAMMNAPQQQAMMYAAQQQQRPLMNAAYQQPPTMNAAYRQQSPTMNAPQQPPTMNAPQQPPTMNAGYQQQQPPTMNAPQQPPTMNTAYQQQQPPTMNAPQHPPAMNSLQQPPTMNSMQYPPTMNAPQHPSTMNSLQHPPTMNALQHPSTMNAPQQPSMMHEQQRPKLDPNAMPSAVQVMEDDRSRTGLFSTGFPTAEVPPLVTTEYYCQDQGNCNPRFMRSTLYCAPASQDLLKTSTIPFGVAICPFARPHRNEHQLPVIDLGEQGPVRCQRCKAYMCAFMEFQDGGRRFRCPFCHASSEVAETYFAHLDHSGRRTDIQHRPEQFLGSYEFVATKLYCKNGLAPKEPAFIFLLDVSYNAMHSGLVPIFCQYIKQFLHDMPKEVGADRSVIRVGFATYDQTVHFYNLKNALDQPQMMVVADINDVFVPFVDGFLVTLEEAEVAIEALLCEIPKMFAQSRITETILGPAVQAGLDALKAADRAGKLFVFHTSLPVFDAPGKLKNRDDRKVLGTDKEKTVLGPQGDFYGKLAEECVRAGCCVDLFLFPNAFIDIATIGTLATTTGGNIYKYQYFEAAKDGSRFLADLQVDISRPIAFDAMMRVRTSTGIRPTGFYGSFYMQNTTDIELAAIDCDKAVNVEIRHDDKLTEPTAFIQTAVLYTTVGGHRRLRIHNMQLTITNEYRDLYKLADQDTVVSFMLKQAEHMVRDKSPKEVREFIMGRCAQILATYRERATDSPAPMGQLILPECLKLLPLYVNCIAKNDAISGGSELTVDDRAWMMQLVASLRVEHSVFFLYPRMLPVTDMDTTNAANALNDPVSTIQLPQAVRAAADNLLPEKAYLIENGLVLFLWIGLGVAPQWAQDVFGVSAVPHIDTEKHILPEKDNATSRTLRALIEQLHVDRPRRMKLFIIRQQDALEPWMKKFLVEDRSAGASSSYVDFLCYIHREIRNLIS